MAIYQPSYVIPDMRSGLGLGVVDAAKDMTVSWRINGPSALTAFSITIYTNDSTSTQMYTTGQLTTGCPAYGTTSAGLPQFFSYAIPSADLATAGITNGGEYKLVIQQWWNENDSVTQSSASAFVTRGMPAVSVSIVKAVTGLEQGNISSSTGEPNTTSQSKRVRTSDFIQISGAPISVNWDNTTATQMYLYFYRADDSFIETAHAWNESPFSVEPPIGTAKIKMVFRSGASNDNITPSAIGFVNVTDGLTTRYGSFTGNYSQAQGDVLNWFRWRIAGADGEGILLDTGNISGTMDISAYYDGFFDGQKYSVRLTVQTENGAEADTGWINFGVSYPTVDTTGSMTAGCVGGTDAVYVEWNGIGYIPGEATGDYSISDDKILTLPTGSSIIWDQYGVGAMSFGAPWSVVWKGNLSNVNADLFTIGQSGGDIKLSYDYSSFTLSLKQGSTTLVSQSGIINSPTVTVILTDTELYIRSDYYGGGLYPNASRYPSASLYPAADTIAMSDVYTLAPTYTQTEITSVSIGGYQVCNFIEVINGSPSAATIASAITNGDYEPGLNDTDYLLANWDDGLNAGVLNLNGDTIEGYALYRNKEGSGVLEKVAETGALVGGVYDYGALSQQGPYTYYLFPIGSTTYISTPIASGMVMPCWWNWTLMECEETADRNLFTVVSAYRFKYNVQTSDITNNNSPGILQNFTRYPTIQLAPQNYKSGTLTALIGAVDWSSGQPNYVDTVDLRDAIFALSTTQRPLFLKTRKGELIRIKISGAISMQTNDATKEQMQTMTLPWVEVGYADGVSLYSLKYSGVQEEEGKYIPQYYVDASDATAKASDLRVKKTAYNADGKIEGSASVEVLGSALIMPDGMEE